MFLARHGRLDRACALKLFETLAFFVEEGRAAAALVHPNVITVHAIGEEGGIPFLEMEYVRGGTLAGRGGSRPRRRRRRAGRVRARGGARGGDRASRREGVERARDAGGRREALRFRLRPPRARRGGLGGAGRRSTWRRSCSGGASGDERTDVYALGVLLHVLLAGGPPFRAATPEELIEAHRAKVVEPPAGLPPRVAECLRALLARDPLARPGDGAAAERMLAAALREARPLDALLQAAFSAQQEIGWEREGPRWRGRLRLAGGRGQTLFVEESGDLVLIWSACCPARPEHHEYALRLNADLPYGSVCIRDLGGVATFVVMATYPRAIVDVETMRRSVVEVARRADEVEGRLAGTDER